MRACVSDDDVVKRVRRAGCNLFTRFVSRFISFALCSFRFVSFRCDYFAVSSFASTWIDILSRRLTRSRDESV